MTVDSSRTVQDLNNPERLKERFEQTCDVFAKTRGMEPEEVFGCVIPYRDWIETNLAQTGQIDPPTFIRWMESAERREEDYPAPRGAHLIEAFDELLIEAVRDYNLQPNQVAKALDEWVEESKQHAIEDGFAEEGFFDV